MRTSQKVTEVKCLRKARTRNQTGVTFLECYVSHDHRAHESFTESSPEKPSVPMTKAVVGIMTTHWAKCETDGMDKVVTDTQTNREWDTKHQVDSDKRQHSTVTLATSNIYKQNKWLRHMHRTNHVTRWRQCSPIVGYHKQSNTYKNYTCWDDT